MFQFEEGKMYQMPVIFGPACGPRQAPHGGRFMEYGPQKSIQHVLAYETEKEALAPYLPEGFYVRRPYIIVTHKMHRNLPWLAGRGYNVTTVQVPVDYQGKEKLFHGFFLLAIWENHGDPIICGREQLGYSKLYADIEDIHTLKGCAGASLFSWDFRFLDLKFRLNEAPGQLELLKSILLDPENEGLMHYKYIPHTGDGFCRPDVACVTLTPSVFPLPEHVPKPAPPKRIWCSGELEWHIPEWEDMPTQFHIVQALARIPVVTIVGASVVELEHYNDVYHQIVIE